MVSNRLTARHQWLVPGVLSVLSAGIVYAIATHVFPYHSLNHDEGVYLLQAAMLLDGQLFITPPVNEAFRPWFFVDSGQRLYPKYSPVPAAMFAIGKLFGGFRLSLAAIAAANVALTYSVVSQIFDRTTGVLAAVFLLASPLFLVQSAVFLPYAPTMLWNLLFATAYIAANTSDDRRWAVLAGGAIGVAFFSRPYTAVLFAAPFIAHALWTLRTRNREAIIRQGLTALFGLVGVAVTLAYNAVVTGSPWLFPYLAFAPHDGLGFGFHKILGYERVYTPELAIRANTTLLTMFFTEWVAAGRLGSLLAVIGVSTFLERARRTIDPHAHPYKLVILGIAVSIIVGNLYFWGTLNVLGVLGRPNDGLVHYLGPYYHFGLLLPTAAFAAYGASETGRYIHGHIRTRVSPDRVRVVVAGMVLISGTVYGVALFSTAAPPIRENLDVTNEYEEAYQPFEERSLDNALVFLPTPYGDWLSHPFQALQNDPGFDDHVVYALRENQFAVVDAFPNRTLYRYAYHGGWVPFAGPSIEPKLKRIRTVRDEQITLVATLSVPNATELISIRLVTEEGHAYAVADSTRDRLTLRLVVENGTAHIEGPVSSRNDRPIPIDDRDELQLYVFVDYGTGAGFTYHIELPTATTHDDVRALTPYLEICRIPFRCGGEAAYIPSSERQGQFIRVTFSNSGTPRNTTGHEETRRNTTGHDEVRRRNATKRNETRSATKTPKFRLA